MSALDDIQTAASTAHAALDAAESLVGPASTAAQELHESAMARGWDSVAQVMYDAWEQLTAADGAITEALLATKDGQQLIAAITDEMSSDDVAGLLIASEERFRTARGSVSLAAEAVDEAHELAVRTDATTVQEPTEEAAGELVRAGSALYEAATSAESEAGSAGSWGGETSRTAVPRGFTRPSFRPDANRMPGGEPKAIVSPKERGLRRENESAIAMARAGYDIEQSPEMPATWLGEPDYRIQGEYWDCYSPKTDEVDTIRTEIKGKVAGNTPRVVLNLDDCRCSPEAIKRRLLVAKVSGLKEIVIVKGGTVTPFYPF